MTRKNVRAPTVDEVNAAGATFSVSDVVAIIESVRLPLVDDDTWIDAELKEQFGAAAVAAELTRLLNTMAFDLRFGKRNQAMPTSAQVKKSAARIVKQAKALSDLIVHEGGEVRAGLGPGALFAHAAIETGDGRAAVHNALTSIEQIRRWATAVVERPSDDPPPPRAGPKRDEAWHLLIYRLVTIYEMFWGKRPALSRDPITGKSGGPLLRFCRAVVDRLKSEKTDEAIASAISELIYAYRDN